MKNNKRRLTTPQSLNAYIKGICDIMRRSGRAGASVCAGAYLDAVFEDT